MNRKITTAAAFFAVVLVLGMFSGCSQKSVTTASQSTTATVTALMPTDTAAENQTTLTTTDTATTTVASKQNTTKKTEQQSALTTQKVAAKATTAKATKATTKAAAKATTKKTAAKTTKAVHYATASDTEAVANALIKYINQFRAQDGQAAATKVGGKMKQLADQRAVSISKNFCHDLQDERRICTAIKFGQRWFKGYAFGNKEAGWVCEDDLIYYEDGEFVPAADGEWHYRPTACTEAIGSDGPYYGNKTVDELAKELATGCRNSAGHWRYVGDGATYPYISVGVVYSGATWYTAVWVGNSHLPEYN